MCQHVRRSVNRAVASIAPERLDRPAVTELGRRRLGAPFCHGASVQAFRRRVDDLSDGAQWRVLKRFALCGSVSARRRRRDCLHSVAMAIKSIYRLLLGKGA